METRFSFHERKFRWIIRREKIIGDDKNREEELDIELDLDRQPFEFL